MNVLYIILPVHNRKELTLRFIRSLLNQTFKKFKLILIDDGSVDETSQEVEKLVVDLITLRGTGDWWWAGSIQQGYDWIKKNTNDNEAVLIINDDLVFDQDYLQNGMNYLSANPNSLVLSAAYNQSKREKLEDCGVIYDFSKNEITPLPVNDLDKLNCLSTRGLFLSAKDFIKTKGMRPGLLPHYYSDYEYTIRAKKKHGLHLKCFLDLKVYMDNQTSGIENIEYKTLREYFKKAFDKRYKVSPLYTFNYYFIAFPFPYNIRFAFIQLKDFVKKVIRIILNF